MHAYIYPKSSDTVCDRLHVLTSVSHCVLQGAKGTVGEKGETGLEGNTSCELCMCGLSTVRYTFQMMYLLKK